MWITAQINTFYTNESQISNVSAPVSVSSEKLPKNFRQQKWSTTNAPNILDTIISSGNPLWPSKNRARLHYYAFYPWRTGLGFLSYRGAPHVSRWRWLPGCFFLFRNISRCGGCRRSFYIMCNQTPIGLVLHLLWIFKVLFIQTHLFWLTVFTSTLYQHFLILAFIWILKVSVLGDLHAVWPLWRQLQYIYWVLEGTIEEDQQLGLLFYAECKLCMCSWTMTSWTDDGHRIASSFPIKVMFFYQFH